MPDTSRRHELRGHGTGGGPLGPRLPGRPYAVRLGLVGAGAMLLALTGCGASGMDKTAPRPSPSGSPTPGPVPGPECDKIWVEGKELPDMGLDFSGCYQIEDGQWVHDATYTDCLNNDPSDPVVETRLWEHTNPETGVRLYAFVDDRSALVENGDRIGELSHAPAIETAESVCVNGS